MMDIINLSIQEILNFIYNHLVARYISVFYYTVDLDTATYNTDSSRQYLRENIALIPKDIGRLGCYWITDNLLGLLDILFMVHMFRISNAEDDIPLVHVLQFNADKYEHSYDNSPFDFIFEMEDNTIFPLGLQLIIFSGWHCDTVLLKHNRSSSLLRIGTPLSDVLYKMIWLTKEKWKSFTLDALL